MKKLVIAEKPSVGKDIAKALGCKNQSKSYIESKDYIITWAMGHLVTLASPETYDKKWEHWNLENLPITFDKPKFEVLKETRHQYNQVKQLINRKDVGQIVIATDAGREGELVARLILLKAQNTKPVKRLWISSNTNKAILDGFKNLKDQKQYYGLYLAALARSEADFILGINATRALTCKYNAKLSAGRVQTPTLNMIYLQDEKVKQHKIQEFYTLSAKAGDYTFNIATKNDRFEIEQFEKTKNSLENKNITITNVKKLSKSKNTPKLYDLTLLQREASVLYNFSAKYTLDIMQGLYEYHKLVSYPRTDSNYLTDDMKPTIMDRVDAVKALGLNVNVNRAKINYKGFINNAKVSDHHAIIPTETRYSPGSLNNDELKIYTLIVKRFMSHLLVPYRYEEIEYQAKIDNLTASTKSIKPIELGFKALYENLIEMDQDEEDLAVNLKELKVGTVLKPSSILVNKRYTKSPKFFTEANLLAAMENPSNYVTDTQDQKILRETKGIGTVATRADIIDKLFNAQVIEKNGVHINITNKGRQLLKVSPLELKSPVLTAQWETILSKIEKNQYDKQKFINEIKTKTINIIENVKNDAYVFEHDNLTEQKCTVCKSQTLFSKSKNGFVLTCIDPGCNHKTFINIPRRNQCPNCMKKLTIIGEKFEKTALFCTGCGHRQNLVTLLKEQSSNKSMSKKEVQKLLNKQPKEQVTSDNPFASIFKK